MRNAYYVKYTIRLPAEKLIGTRRCQRNEVRPVVCRLSPLSIRLSRLICSNSSTLDRAIPDLHADDD